MSNTIVKPLVDLQTTHTNSLMMPTGKATAAAPKLSDDGHVELGDMLPASPDPQQDIMQMARVGDIQGIEGLYASGRFDKSYRDEEGITPLHVNTHPQIAKC